MLYSQIMRLYPLTAIGFIAVSAWSQQTPQQIVGGITSTAPIAIDGTSMAPAPSWPLVDRDVVQTTSAPGKVITSDQNSVTLLPDTAVRVRKLPPRETWFFVRQGGVTLDTKNSDVRVCIANRVFQPAGPAKGSIQFDKAGAVTRTVTSGSIAELQANACGEEIAGGMTGSGNPVAGGTATAPSPTANRVTEAAALTGLIGLFFTGGSPPINCSVPGACNFNPAPVSPSGP